MSIWIRIRDKKKFTKNFMVTIFQGTIFLGDSFPGCQRSGVQFFLAAIFERAFFRRSFFPGVIFLETFISLYNQLSTMNSIVTY